MVTPGKRESKSAVGVLEATLVSLRTYLMHEIDDPATMDMLLSAIVGAEECLENLIQRGGRVERRRVLVYEGDVEVEYQGEEEWSDDYDSYPYNEDETPDDD